MTTKLSNEQKKYNELVNALDNTWNCDYKCDVCPFRQTDGAIDVWKDNQLCGAVIIREYAIKIFEKRNPKIKEILDLTYFVYTYA